MDEIDEILKLVEGNDGKKSKKGKKVKEEKGEKLKEEKGVKLKDTLPSPGKNLFLFYNSILISEKALVDLRKGKNERKNVRKKYKGINKKGRLFL